MPNSKWTTVDFDLESLEVRCEHDRVWYVIPVSLRLGF